MQCSRTVTLAFIILDYLLAFCYFSALFSILVFFEGHLSHSLKVLVHTNIFCNLPLWNPSMFAGTSSVSRRLTWRFWRTGVGRSWRGSCTCTPEHRPSSTVTSSATTSSSPAQRAPSRLATSVSQPWRTNPSPRALSVSSMHDLCRFILFRYFRHFVWLFKVSAKIHGGYDENLCICLVCRFVDVYFLLQNCHFSQSETNRGWHLMLKSPVAQN